MRNHEQARNVTNIVVFERIRFIADPELYHGSGTFLRIRMTCSLYYLPINVIFLKTSSAFHLRRAASDKNP